jgi:hypothetical protein
MNHVSSTAKVIAYLIPRRERFWRWETGSLNAEWRDGRTIAFRQELVEVLGHLAPLGLPPLGAVLMVLAACRDSWGAADNVGRLLSGYSCAFEDDLKGVPKSLGLIISAVVPAAVRMDVMGVVEELDRIAELPAELRGNMRGKRAIIETVFEGLSRLVPPERADAIVRALSEGFDPERLCEGGGSDDGFAQLGEELQSLRIGLARVDAERLRLRLRTGLDQTVRPASIELPDATKVRNLLDRLRDDAELAGVTRLARNLLAAIHVPRALAAPQDLPVGGVSDLTNRGQLDRLLVSELAHDDLTLTTRIALNEALYLRREAPRSAPPHDRVIMIDTGIRLWGIPRVFAVGVALALAASCELKARVRAFRSDGSDAPSVDLTTRAGLLAQLEALDAAPHPGEAVRAMLKEVGPGSDGADVMIVTHADVAADPEFLRLMREIGDSGEREWHLATVTAEGAFRLERVGRAGRRTLCTADIPLDDLLAAADGRRAAPVPLRDPDADPSLPVIFSLDPFPLLLPAQADTRRAIVSTHHGLLAVTSDGRLMRWTSDRRGADELRRAVPPGTSLGLFVDDAAGVVFHVSQDTSSRYKHRTHVLMVDLKENAWYVTHRDAHGPLRAAALSQGTLLHLYDCRIVALDARGATVGDFAPPAGTLWGSGRFYRSAAGWSAAYFDGHEVGLTYVTDRHSLAIFDREGHGPWQVFREGYVAAVAGTPLAATKPREFSTIDRVHISADGDRILGQVRVINVPSAERASYFLDLNEQPSWNKVPRESHDRLVGSAINWSRNSGVNVFTRFDGIYVGTGGDLVLVRGWRGLAIRLTPTNDLRLRPARREDDDLRNNVAARFGPGRRPRGARFTLRTATWKDGSQAFLDSRGMLHLKSADPRLPEITLVLTNSPIGGRTSEGHTFGWAFFHGEAPTTQPEYAHSLLLRFSSRLR